MLTMLRQIFNLVKAGIYANDTIIVFRHEMQTRQKSSAKVFCATEKDLPDVLSFRPQQYTGRLARLYRLEKFKNVFREDDIRRSWSKGDLVFLAHLNGMCVSRCWVRCGPQTVFLQFPFLRMNLGVNEAFVLYEETIPEARGKNILPHVLSWASRALEKKGFSVYCSVQERNVPAVRASIKAGFIQVQRIRFIGFLWISVKKSLEQQAWPVGH